MEHANGSAGGGEGKPAGQQQHLLYACSEKGLEGKKRLQRRLKQHGRLMTLTQSAITLKLLEDRKISVLILLLEANEKERPSDAEREAVKTFVDKGGGVVALVGGADCGSGAQRMLKDLGFKSQHKPVMRTVPANPKPQAIGGNTCVHPLDIFVQNGIVNRAVNTFARDYEAGFQFVLSSGCALNMRNGSVPILSSGKHSMPEGQPVCALGGSAVNGYGNEGDAGHTAVFGSTESFSDQWIDKADNSRLLDLLVGWAGGKNRLQLNELDASGPEISATGDVPDVATCAEAPRGALQEPAPIPHDFTQLLDTQTFSLNMDAVPDALRLYEKVGVEKERLQVPKPEFDTVPPRPTPAVCPVLPTEPSFGTLEAFDLDASFASSAEKITAAARRCENAADMVEECSRALQIGRPGVDSPERLLIKAFAVICKAKCSAY